MVVGGVSSWLVIIYLSYYEPHILLLCSTVYYTLLITKIFTALLQLLCLGMSFLKLVVSLIFAENPII